MLSRSSSHEATAWKIGPADWPPAPPSITPRAGLSTITAITKRGSSAGAMPAKVIQYSLLE